MKYTKVCYGQSSTLSVLDIFNVKLFRACPFVLTTYEGRAVNSQDKSLGLLWVPELNGLPVFVHEPAPYDLRLSSIRNQRASVLITYEQYTKIDNLADLSMNKPDYVLVGFIMWTRHCVEKRINFFEGKRAKDWCAFSCKYCDETVTGSRVRPRKRKCMVRPGECEWFLRYKPDIKDAI